MADLTKAQRSALASLCWGLAHFDGFFTGRTTRKSTVLTLVQLGLAAGVDELLVSDRYPDRDVFRRWA